MNDLLAKYNHSDSLLLISLYPKRGEVYSSGMTGVASYAKNVVSKMNRRVVVLAQMINGPEIYEEGNVLVVRCFSNGNPTMYKNIIKYLYIFKNIKNVLVQFDFAIWGSPLNSFLMVMLMGMLKVLGKNVSVTLHHVVTDIRKLSGHVGLSDSFGDSIKAHLYNGVFHFFYWTLSCASSQIIVLEKTLQKKLETLCPHAQIVTIPHGVDINLKSRDKETARKQLRVNRDEYVITFFGYVNWFKGADLFVNFYENVNKMLGHKTRFIIAGGKSATLGGRPYYESYYNKVAKTAAADHFTITGYVPQDEIATYFAASDIVVFPYRHYMTASGVLSLVFSYKKPFIVSKELEKMFNAQDFFQAFGAAKLSQDDVVFDLTAQSCVDLTKKVLKNGIKQKMSKVAMLMREKRSYVNTAKLYDAALFPQPTYLSSKKPALAYTT